MKCFLSRSAIFPCLSAWLLLCGCALLQTRHPALENICCLLWNCDFGNCRLSSFSFGRRYGRHSLLGTKKTVEGTLGGILCNTLAWCLLPLFLERERTFYDFALASSASCILEAATTQLDNIFLPLHHFGLHALVCLLRLSANLICQRQEITHPCLVISMREGVFAL